MTAAIVPAIDFLAPKRVLVASSGVGSGCERAMEGAKTTWWMKERRQEAYGQLQTHSVR